MEWDDSPIKLTEILSKVDIAVVVGSVAQLYRKHDQPFILYCECPLCKKGEMEVVWPRNVFICRRCGSAGNSFGFMRLLHQCDVKEAIGHLSELILGAFPADQKTVIAATQMPKGGIIHAG